MKLPEEEEQPIGIWGQRHLGYLKQHCKVTYTNLLTNGKLNVYLAGINKQAQGITEQIKAENALEWTGQLNNIKACARARQYVMISMWNQMYELLLPGLEECQSRGCKVLGVGYNLKNPVAQIKIHHDGKYHNMPENLRWFIISADGEKLLYGYSAEMDKDAFYTEDTSHIYLLEDYMIHDMVVNRLVSDRENEEELLIEAINLQITVIREPDAQTQSR